jgi:hypothetical protein
MTKYVEIKWSGVDTLIRPALGAENIEVKKGDILSMEEKTALKLQKTYPRYVEILNGLKPAKKSEPKVETAKVKSTKKAVLKKD